MSDFDPLRARFGDQFHPNDSLARYTVARLGGKAAGVLRVKSREELIWAARWAHEAGIKWIVLGGGSNVLPADRGFDGLVIINMARESHIDAQTGIVSSDSGTVISTLARLCMAQGLAGLEWAVSVPGTLGGAVINNAGAHGGDMAGILLDAQVLDVQLLGHDESRSSMPSADLQTWSVSDMHYAYRHSVLKGQHGRYVVIGARLKLESGHHPAELNRIADGFVAHRKETQPPGASLGSMFKNPEGDYAGRLIEAAGLKGTQIGGVQISPVHANFFINIGGGTAADYQALIELAQKTVKAKFGISLELEVERIGDWE